jgi:hypothetical protein
MFVQIKGQVIFKGEIITKMHKKMGWGHLKIFSRTTVPILTRLGKNHPSVRGFRIVQMKGNSPVQGEIIAKE